jgi:hypothetical protein
MKDYHYYAADTYGWTTDEDCNTAIQKRINDTGACLIINVWLVPLPEKASYSIDYYKPEVEGVKFLFQVKGNGKTKAIKEVHHFMPEE